jgi:hypothetical protein
VREDESKGEGQEQGRRMRARGEESEGRRVRQRADEEDETARGRYREYLSTSGDRSARNRVRVKAENKLRLWRKPTISRLSEPACALASVSRPHKIALGSP